MSDKQLSVTAMKAIGYTLLAMFERDAGDEKYDTLNQLGEIGWEEYHNFWKCQIPEGWYEGLLDCMELWREEVLVEVARVRGNHAKDLHYHRESHAICIVLGTRTGFPSPFRGSVVIDDKEFPAYEGMECYFPVGCKHTFHGGDSTTEDPEDTDLYFISIQSPPLEGKDGSDDFYLVG